jgi:hypothetical protein
MSTADPKHPNGVSDHGPVIDTSGMSRGKAEALELTEASREGHWEYPTVAGALFMGELPSRRSSATTWMRMRSTGRERSPTM